MAIRNDITVDWYDSPRTVLIAQPSTTITCQDLHDTLVGIQDTLEGSEFPDLIDSTGKGGGVTGIVAILQNAQVLFEPRTTVIENGTITTADTTGRDLIDSTAAFVTNGVSRGDMVVNKADFSHATVLSVISETQLRTLVLAGGTDDQYQFGDSYDIFDYEIASITDGDLFAVDDVGADISPILNSFGVFGPIVELSTSPALIETGVSGLTPTESATHALINGIHGQLHGIESGKDHDWFMRIFMSALGNMLIGPDPGVAGTVTGRDRANTKDRITAPVNQHGWRTTPPTLDGD